MREKSLKCNEETYFDLADIQLYLTKRMKFPVTKKFVMKKAIAFYKNAIAQSLINNSENAK